MASSSAYNFVISQNKRSFNNHGYSSILQNNPLLPFISISLFSSKLPLLTGSKFTVCSVAKIIPPQVEQLDQQSSDFSPPSPNPSWSEFADRISGEWDGFGAEFTTEGKPIELPESVVPEAYREWEVKVHDWQTQCPTLADPQTLFLSYRTVRLLPTVGCEADAATVYNSDDRKIGGEQSNNSILAFAYEKKGCYVALWLVQENDVYKLFEVEHCLVDPRDKESRVRVIQTLRLEGSKMKLQRIKVFCELWYGPFRNGDQLGGCAVRDSAFAATPVLNASDVTGVWQSRDALTASYQSSQDNLLKELVDKSTEKIVRNQNELIMLPRQLWCSLKESGNGDTLGEVGWLLDTGFAISSRCIFSSDGKLKEITVGHETSP
ncbi:Root meristem growth factor 4 [Bienertia sinuspersici]